MANGGVGSYVGLVAVKSWNDLGVSLSPCSGACGALNEAHQTRSDVKRKVAEWVRLEISFFSGSCLCFIELTRFSHSLVHRRASPGRRHLPPPAAQTGAAIPSIERARRAAGALTAGDHGAGRGEGAPTVKKGVDEERFRV